ncbi:MAG: transporter [Paucimonas sp.]|jgi:phospholipid-binding lipoprotein MlaA|nr:transporter [Paucimonas sp.]
MKTGFTLPKRALPVRPARRYVAAGLHAFKRGTATFVSIAVLGGCAVGKDPRDPLENFNRAMFQVNETVDRYALKPTAEVYRENVPSFAQTGVYNFFGNLGDVWTAANNLLQGKVGDGVSDVMRVAINTFFGVGGVLDIASEAGLPKHKQDFGVTLGVWGLGSGPYVILPLLGPSTLRDTAALPADLYGDVWREVRPVWQRNVGAGLRVVDLRSGLLDAGNLIEEAALDRYEFMRDGYLQRRAAKVKDSASRMPREEVEEAEPAKDKAVPAK